MSQPITVACTQHGIVTDSVIAIGGVKYCVMESVDSTTFIIRKKTILVSAWLAIRRVWRTVFRRPNPEVSGPPSGGSTAPRCSTAAEIKE